MNNMTLGPARRVRHELRFRRLTVQTVTRLTPHMIRIRLSGDMAGFVSLGFADHLKVLLPAPGQSAVAEPEFTEMGPKFPDGQRPMMRDYTPRAWDVAAGWLDLDFALHETGPATLWARDARSGDTLAIAGPRGSLIVPLDCDHYLLVGDETALPAISRRLEELPAGVRATAIIEVDSREEEQTLDCKADLDLVWLHRNGAEAGLPDRLVPAVRALQLDGTVQAWCACESLVARAVRQILAEEKQVEKSRIRASGYWRRGAQGVHEPQHD